MKAIPAWVPVVLILVLVAALGTAIYGYGYGVEQYGQGELAERAAWEKRENTELTAANTRIIELSVQVRAQEAKHAEDMAAVSKTYQEQLQHEKSAKDRTIADLRSGALRLRIELARRKDAAGNPAGPAGPGAVGCDGEARAELSVTAAEFLVGLASEADEVVHQLTACQAVVAADRRINHTQGEQ